MSAAILYPDLRPDISRVRAIVTTKWGNSGYRPIVIPKLESYYVDTALDNDADTWTCDVGDPRGDLISIFNRDSEIRVQLFGVGSEGQTYLMTGLADEATFDEQVTLTLTGRDLSSVAVDSIVPPKQYRQVRAHAVVAQQAKELGFKNVQLAQAGQVKKVQYTDGSESYWEFWYRLYRKEKMWLWCEPNGILVANKLNYDAQTTYYFGQPQDNDTQYVKRIYLPVERAEIRKTTQARVGEVWVYGHKGDNGFLSISKDPTLNGWVKKPRKIMLDTDSHTTKGAQKLGFEEIFEGKVGSVEIRLTIPDPGFMIKQNRVAHINLPEIGLAGDFFIVGVRAQGGQQGFLQEVRLREKNYSISRRVPTDPKLVTHHPGAGANVGGGLGAALAGSVGNMPESWGQYFVSAAKEFHGPWDYNLFLATLIGIADRETGGAFLNERQNGGPGGDHHEWTPPPKPGATNPGEIIVPGVTPGTGFRAPSTPVNFKTVLEAWKERFANEAGDGYVTVDYGVGPMQLTSVGIKNQADDHYKMGNRDEFQGGRWHPEHNIWAGAKYLRSCLQGTVRDSGRDIDMWMGVMAYNRGIAGALAYFTANGQPSEYALAIKNKVYTDPGYLPQVKTARDEAVANAKADPGDSISPSPGTTNDTAALERLTWLRKANSTVDLSHVDWRLLNSLNSLGAHLGRIITITSGFRTYAQQAALYDRYRLSGFNRAYIAAKPGTSNHEFGKATDCEIGGVPMTNAVPAWQLAVFGLHCPVSGDLPHTTLLEVTG